MDEVCADIDVFRRVVHAADPQAISAAVESLQRARPGNLDALVACIDEHIRQRFIREAQELLQTRSDLLQQNADLLNESVAAFVLLDAKAGFYRSEDCIAIFARVSAVEDLYIDPDARLEEPAQQQQLLPGFRRERQDAAASKQSDTLASRRSRKSHYAEREANTFSFVKLLVAIFLLELDQLADHGGLITLEERKHKLQDRLPALVRYTEHHGLGYYRHRCMILTDAHEFMGNRAEAVAFLESYTDSLDPTVDGKYLADILGRMASYQCAIAPDLAREHLDKALLLYDQADSKTNMLAIHFLRVRDLQSHTHKPHARFGELEFIMSQSLRVRSVEMHWLAFQLAITLAGTCPELWPSLERCAKDMENHAGEHDERSMILEMRLVMHDHNVNVFENLEQVRGHLRELLEMKSGYLTPRQHAKVLKHLHHICMRLEDDQEAFDYATQEIACQYAAKRPYYLSASQYRLANAEKQIIFRQSVDQNPIWLRDKSYEFIELLRPKLDHDMASGWPDLWTEKVNLVLLMYHNLMQHKEALTGNRVEDEYYYWLHRKQSGPSGVQPASRSTASISQVIHYVRTKDWAQAVQTAQSFLAECAENSAYDVTQQSIARGAMIGSLIGAYMTVKAQSLELSQKMIRSAFDLLDIDAKELRLKGDSDALLNRSDLYWMTLKLCILTWPDQRDWYCSYADDLFRSIERILELLRRSAQKERGLARLMKKQGITGRAKVSKFYNSVASVFLSVQDVRRGWQWIQKGRGRAMIDMLEDRNVAAESVVKVIEQDTIVSTALSEEQRLVDAVSSAGLEDYITAVSHLAQHREKMKALPAVAQLLAAQGDASALDFEQLDIIRLVCEWIAREKNVLLVDWFIDVKGGISRIVVDLKDRDAPPQSSFLPITAQQVKLWADFYMQFPVGRRRPLETMWQAFASLRPLLAGLEQTSQDGDLLLFCPSGILGNIPLHAIPLFDRSPIIHRNLVVYCSSLSLYRTCIERTNRLKPGRSFSQSRFTAAYEEVGYERERAEILQQTEELANTFGAREHAVLGQDLDANTFREALSKTPWIHYHGHAYYDAENIISQGFVLSDGNRTRDQLTDTLTDERRAGDTSESAIATETEPAVTEAFLSQHLLADSSKVTVADIFSMDLSQHHPFIYSMACESGVQKIGPGDEPLGLITALFCAGASSTMSTFWPVRSKTARLFSAHFYSALSAQMKLCEPAKSSIMLNLAEAARSATLQVKLRHPDPYAWAAFALHGSGFFPILL